MRNEHPSTTSSISLAEKTATTRTRRKAPARSLNARLERVASETAEAREIATRVLSLIEELERADLHALRINSGMTQEELARIAGVATRTWVRWERRELQPQWFRKIKRVCRTLAKE